MFINYNKNQLRNKSYSGDDVRSIKETSLCCNATVLLSNIAATLEPKNGIIL